ncbi:MAG: hypothetical protein OXC26_04985 [Albidovulum sp.]|nr:hypothetical protein [Albidovulum sp.]
MTSIYGRLVLRTIVLGSRVVVRREQGYQDREQECRGQSGRTVNSALGNEFKAEKQSPPPSDDAALIHPLIL